MFTLTKMQATITSFTGRTETHGKEKVPALTLGFRITTANTILDVISDTLRTTLYKAVDEHDQADLPDVEPTTPLLRNDAIDTITLDKSFEGWTVEIDHGIDDSDPIVLGSCKVDAFKVDAHEGGTVDLYFRAGTSACDYISAGLLWSKNGQGVVLTVTPPEAVPEAIDGSAEGGGPGFTPRGDEPAPDEGRGATDAFLHEHGGAGEDDRS